MYLISNRDLEVIIGALEVIDYDGRKSTAVYNKKRMAKLLIAKLKSKKPVESFEQK